LALSLPRSALEFASSKAFAQGLESRAAAVLICHDHSRRLCQRLIDENEPASGLVEFALAARIDGSAELASAMDQDLLDLLPDLPVLLRQPCFSGEFRDAVSHIVTWHGISDHRWSEMGERPDVSDRVGA
jgi:hypothetical protein